MKIFQRVNHAADRRLAPIWLLLSSTILTTTLLALGGISRAEEAVMQSTKTSEANCELVVEGGRVEKIYYLKEGETHVFSDHAVQRGKSLFLPRGTYRVSFELQGGYWGCRNELLQVNPEVPARLQVGNARWMYSYGSRIPLDRCCSNGGAFQHGALFAQPAVFAAGLLLPVLSEAF